MMNGKHAEIPSPKKDPVTIAYPWLVVDQPGGPKTALRTIIMGPQDANACDFAGVMFLLIKSLADNFGISVEEFIKLVGDEYQARGRKAKATNPALDILRRTVGNC